jgi:hypothetical protein
MHFADRFRWVHGFKLSVNRSGFVVSGNRQRINEFWVSHQHGVLAEADGILCPDGDFPSTRSRRTSRSSATMCPAAPMRRITRRRNGSRSLRASSTWAGTHYTREIYFDRFADSRRYHPISHFGHPPGLRRAIHRLYRCDNDEHFCHRNGCTTSERTSSSPQNVH